MTTQGISVGRAVGSEPGEAVALSTDFSFDKIGEEMKTIQEEQAKAGEAAAEAAPAAAAAKPTTIVVVQDTAPAETKKTKAVNIENLIDIKNITEIYFKNNHLEKIIEKFEKEEELLPPE